MTNRLEKAKKLTKAQRELLWQIKAAPGNVAGHYQPAKKLVEYGLAEWVRGKWDDRLAITPLGLTAIQQIEDQK